MKDLKSLVLKRDNYQCLFCKGAIPENGEDEAFLTELLHLHHEYGTYKDEYWPREDVPEKCVILCARHHARRTQDSHYSETRDIRKYLKNQNPDYNFGKRFNENTGAYDIPIGEF